MKVKISIYLKEGVLDPQGKAIHEALHALGYEDVKEVKVSKLINLDIEGEDKEAITKQALQMCEDLLANPVIESYEIDL